MLMWFLANLSRFLIPNALIFNENPAPICSDLTDILRVLLNQVSRIKSHPRLLPLINSFFQLGSHIWNTETFNLNFINLWNIRPMIWKSEIFRPYPGINSLEYLIPKNTNFLCNLRYISTKWAFKAVTGAVCLIT